VAERAVLQLAQPVAVADAGARRCVGAVHHARFNASTGSSACHALRTDVGDRIGGGAPRGRGIVGDRIGARRRRTGARGSLYLDDWTGLDRQASGLDVARMTVV
jgi:hypothetical protein